MGIMKDLISDLFDYHLQLTVLNYLRLEDIVLDYNGHFFLVPNSQCSTFGGANQIRQT
jgi:hypothetical protein